MSRLPPPQLDQRIVTAEVAFRGLGRVHVVDPGAISNQPRTISIEIDHPGWGLPTTAKLAFVERWIQQTGACELTKYAYDLWLVPGPARLAFHWHDAVYHTHCVDPDEPTRDHHYRGGQADLFAAYQEYGRILASGDPISCQALRPLRG